MLLLSFTFDLVIFSAVGSCSGVGLCSNRCSPSVPFWESEKMQLYAGQTSRVRVRVQAGFRQVPPSNVLAALRTDSPRLAQLLETRISCFDATTVCVCAVEVHQSQPTYLRQPTHTKTGRLLAPAAATLYDRDCQPGPPSSSSFPR
jgi:hypothetical protein